MGDVVLTIMTLIVVRVAQADARRFGVRPLRRLASDEELNQPPGRSRTTT